jgi:hypothetical protein
METLWDSIHRDLTGNESVDVRELTDHLHQLYSKIEELETEIRQLKDK